MRYRRAIALVALVLVPSLASGAEETFGQKIISGALSSAGGKGGEFAVKFVSGWIYNLSCKPEQQTDEGSKALCSALGGVSGKSDEEWKKKIESKLEDISNKLGALESGQKQILNTLSTQHKEMEAQFKQVPTTVRATAILTTIDSFWGRFKNDVRPDTPASRTDLEKFARDVMRANLHRELGELNSLLSHPIDNSQALLHFPFYQYRQKHSQGTPPEAHSLMPTYDYAEKKFVYYRGELQKGYLIYLWAAEIIQSGCELAGDAKCEALPITSTAFAREYDRYTGDQLETFNSSANGLLLAYSRPEDSTPNFLLRNPGTERILMRLSYLNSTILGTGRGAWGQVIATEGDPWDGKIALECSGGVQTLAPAFNYSLPVDTLNVGPWIDWWTGPLDRGAYNAVHFSRNWRIHHYKYEEAKAGPCRVRQVLPNGADRLPWTAEDAVAVAIPGSEDQQVQGFFHAIRRAGGTFALASGQTWTYFNPETSDSGDATKKETRFDWTTDPNHAEGLWVSLLNSARVDHTVGKSIINNNQEARVTNRMYAFGRKAIFFPEKGTVGLHLLQHPDCAKVCVSSTVQPGILDYDIEHSPYEEGNLTAVVAVFFDPQQGYGGTNFDRARNGVFVDGSYGNTKDRKTKRVADRADGAADVSAPGSYFLQYLMHFDLKTHSKRVDSTRYRFMGKITPMLLYVTKK
jgi:hypothetical protein